MELSSNRTTQRSRRRSNRPQTPTSPIANQKPFQQPRMTLPLTPAVSEDELQAIHNASMRVLQEIGIDMLSEDAKRRFKNAGAQLMPDSDRVRMDAALIEDAISSAPPDFMLHARNPAHNLQIGGDHFAFCQAASPPNCSDMIGGRRVGNLHDFRQFLKLAQSFNIIHLTAGYPVEPVDLHPSIRHLDCSYDLATLTDKVFHVYSLGVERNRDAMEIARIARGIDQSRFEDEASIFTVINASSPLRYDTPMLEGIIEMAAKNQCVVITPFTLAGAMAPVTIAGALVQQNAEALAGIALTQLVRPGAPVVYGGFTSNVDMKSGAPAFGTPEYMKAVLVGGQLARKYNIPYRTSNVCAANTVDAQAAYETGLSLWSLVMGGGHLIKHSAGWLEGGLTMSYEKMIVDVDMLQMVAEFLEPLAVDDASLAIEAIADVGPGGHFFGTSHTQERYRDAFYSPLVSDWRNYESWSEAGAPTAFEKANQVYQDVLHEYEQPDIDQAIHEELDAYVTKRKQEGGIATDY